METVGSVPVRMARAGGGGPARIGAPSMSAAVAAETPLAYERRLRPRYAVVALLAGILLIAVVVIQTTGPQAKVAERTLQLIVGSKRGTQDIIGAIATAIDALAIAGALYFLISAVTPAQPRRGPVHRARCA